MLWLSWLLTLLPFGFPLPNGSLPIGELLALLGFAFLADTGDEGCRGLELVRIARTPLRSELAFEGVFQDGLAVDFELLARLLQILDALVQFGKQFLDLGDDAVLFICGGNNNG